MRKQGDMLSCFMKVSLFKVKNKWGWTPSKDRLFLLFWWYKIDCIASPPFVGEENLFFVSCLDSPFFCGG